MKKLSFMRLNVERKYFLIVFLVFILILVTTVSIREYRTGGILAGKESYFNLRISEDILENNFLIPNYDDLSFNGRQAIYFFVWPFVLAFFSLLFFGKILLASKIVPIILSSISFYLFYLILKNLKFKFKLRIVSLLVLAVSPAFLYLSLISTKYTGIILITLLAFYLFSSKKYIYSGLVLILLPFFDVAGAIVSFVLFFIDILFWNRKKLWVLIFFIISFLGFHFNRIITYGFPETLQFKLKENGINFILQRLISDLGGEIAIGLFAFIIAIIGLGFLWHKKWKNFLIFLIFIFLVIVSFYFEIAVFYLNFFVAVLSAFALISLLKMKWESKLIKDLGIFILILGLIFSGLSYVNRVTLMEPTPLQVEGFNYLKEHGNEGTVVFSHYSRGFWISGIAEKTNVWNNNFFYVANVNKKFEDFQTILYSDELDVTGELLKSYSIDYIYLDNGVKKIVWGENEETGLLYLLKYSKNFKNVFSNDEVEIWRVT